MQVLSYMQLFARKYLIVICLYFSTLAALAHQENKYSFTWLDRSEKMLAGNITVTLTPLQEEGLFQLLFSVEWYDKDGNQISLTSQMPYLCLSKWDLDIDPAENVKCTSFGPKQPFIQPVQSSGFLNLQVLNGYQGEIKFTARFKYALTRDLFESGKLEKIDIKGTNDLKLVFTIRSQKQEADRNVIADEGQKASEAKRIAAIIGIVSGNYQKTRLLVKELQDKKSFDEFNRPNYLEDMEILSQKIDFEKARLNPDSLPVDTLQHYREYYNRLSDDILDLRTAYLRFQTTKSAQGSKADSSGIDQKSADSLRNLIRNRFQPVILRQKDTLNRIAAGQNLIASEMNGLIANGTEHNPDTPRIDSLVKSHGSSKNAFLAIKHSHEDTWKKYRVDLGMLLPVSEIENLHSQFLEDLNNVQSSIDSTDRAIASMGSATVETPWYMSNRLVWTGLLAVLVFVFISAIWSTSRNKKILRERLNLLNNNNPASLTARDKVPGIFIDETAEEYYTVDYKDDISEFVVGKVHYHTSLIKFVYHTINSAILDRKAGDFGGYLFGNQYKLAGKGGVRSEIFIEKACDSRYLRSSIANEINARADLIEELNGLVDQNKKYRLVGWYTSSTDSSLEIPEGLMKVHRSFFKEKWQIGILINSGSEVLQGAAFFRRKSGFLDPMPDPAAFLKWDELYRFALNPSSAAKNEQPGIERLNMNYSRIQFNNTWGDSIVTAINFDPLVVSEIIAAAAIQAIPRDNFQVVGYLYGTAESRAGTDGKIIEYEVFVDRFIELNNESAPRELPGFMLLGWWGQSNVDVINYLQQAVDYHELSFREAFQVSCLVNTASGELRIFTRKHSLEMNNSTIETEEYELMSLLSR